MQGSVWIASRHDLCGDWSQAGGILTLGVAGPWFDLLPEQLWPEDEDQRAMIRKVRTSFSIYSCLSPADEHSLKDGGHTAF